MADMTTENKSNQFFSGTGTNTVHFSRPIGSMILTVTGTVSFSLDGANFVTIAEGTHQFSYLYIKDLYLQGSGTYQGFGLAV